MIGIEVVARESAPPSLAHASGIRGPLLRLGIVQQRWHPDPEEHENALEEGIRKAVRAGAQIVCMQELTLSPYFASDPRGAASAGVAPESLDDGPTRRFAAAMAAKTGALIHASLFEAAPSAEPLGYNTAIVVAPSGQLLLRTRKLHIPLTAGYHEDMYFKPGPSTEEDPFRILDIGGAGVGFPTCWDQWFPELARAYSLKGADVIVYPTAIGSEPDFPQLDTQPLWETVIRANGIANATFMVAANRVGTENDLTFYGSSFISDPFGRILVQAPRDSPAVLVADLDLAQCRDWLQLFPFLRTRRPDAYRVLVEPHI